MEPSTILILVAIVLLGIAIMGGGTMVFCCHGFERGLPFISVRELYEELADLDKRTSERYRDFALLVNNVAVGLQKEAADLPSKLLVKDLSTIIDMEEGRGTVGCQSTPAHQVMVAPAPAEVIISIPEE